MLVRLNKFLVKLLVVNNNFIRFAEKEMYAKFV